MQIPIKYQKKELFDAFYHLKQRIMWRTRKGMRIKCDMRVGEFETWRMHIQGRKTVGYARQDFYTDETPEELHELGYLKCDGLYDSIVFWGIPVYLRVTGVEQFDIAVRDEQGRLLYSQDSACTLHDVMTSTATRDFIKGMARASFATMDLQKMAMLGIVAVGALVGMWVLGIF